jgi:hypothetical protein
LQDDEQGSQVGISFIEGELKYLFEEQLYLGLKSKKVQTPLPENPGIYPISIQLSNKYRFSPSFILCSVNVYQVVEAKGTCENIIDSSD